MFREAKHETQRNGTKAEYASEARSAEQMKRTHVDKMTDSTDNTPAVEYPSIVEARPPPQSLIVSYGMGVSEYDSPPHVIVTKPSFPNIIGYTRVETPVWSFHICSARWPARPLGDYSISIRITPNTELEICAGGATTYTNGILWSHFGWIPFGEVSTRPSPPIERYGRDYYYSDAHYRREFYLRNLK